MPTCVSTSRVRPPRSSSSTVTSVVVGCRPACPVRGRQHVAVRVGHRLGVDEALVRDDLAVLAGEPHPHRAAGRVQLHADQAGPPTRTSILATGTSRRRGRTRPRSARARSTAARTVHRRREGALDHHRVRRAVVLGHRRHPFSLWRRVGRGSRPSGRSGPPTGRYCSRPGRDLLERRRVEGARPVLGPPARMTNPARSSTLMCFETAGSVSANGSANSLTLASPSASRARIARRVEFASAAKVSLSRSSSIGDRHRPVTFHIG